MTQSNNSSSGVNSVLVIILAVIVIALLVLAFFYLTNREPTLVGDIYEEDQFVLIDEVDFQSAETDQDRLPAGFPFGLPINYETMTYSESADYSQYTEGLVRFNVAFTAESDATTESVVASFQEYFDNNNYEVQLDEQGGPIIAEADAGRFLVFITESSNQIEVQIEFTPAS